MSKFRLLNIVVILTLGLVSCLLLFNWVLHQTTVINGNSDFNSAISATASFSSAIATTCAALIALFVFQDWKEVELYKRSAQILDKTYNNVLELQMDLTDLLHLSQKKGIKIQDRVEKTRQLRKKIHLSITFIAMDHERLIKSNKDIKQLFNAIESLLEDYIVYMKILHNEIKQPSSDFKNSIQRLDACLNKFNSSLDLIIDKNLNEPSL